MGRQLLLEALPVELEVPPDHLGGQVQTVRAVSNPEKLRHLIM
jgi:hypothetical protein